MGYLDNVPTNYYCSHCLSYHQPDVSYNDLFCELTFNANGGTNLFFYNIPFTAVEEFKSWANENNVTVAYPLMYMEKTDLSNSDFGKTLLKLSPWEDATAIIEINSQVIASKMRAVYSSRKNADTYNLIVRYKDIEGKEISISKEQNVIRNSLYEIIPPKIDGYIAIEKSVVGCISQDTEITLIYSNK